MLINDNVIQSPRANPEIVDGLNELERRLLLSGGEEPVAWNEMLTSEMDFVANQLYLSTRGPGITGLKYWLSNFFFIKDKNAGFHALWPFWDSQEMLLVEIDDRWRANQAVWLMILKARQLGISTLVEGIILYLTIFNKNWNSLLLADEAGQTEYIFEMARNGYDSLPWWMKPEKRYDVKGHHMIFDRANELDRLKRPGNKSQLIAESANQRSGSGYGKTFLALHASEVPKYKDARVLTEGILPTVPENNPAVVAILEGAAQKRHDHWHRLWKAAEAGLTKFDPLFIPWYGESQYFLAPPDGWVPTDETKGMLKSVKETYQIDLTPGQAHWYQNKRDDYIAFEDDDATFLTQFPSNPHEAFQNAGRCAFSKRKLHRLLRFCGKPPKWRGKIWLAENNKQPKLAQLSANDDKLQSGSFMVWQWAWDFKVADATFYVAGDPSGGTATGHPACWQVFYVPTSPFEPVQQVAMWYGKAGPSQFARIGAAIGYLYRKAEVNPEANNMGQTVISDLKNVLEYPNLYRWRREDKINNTITDFFGWLMTSQSKKSLLTRMAEGIDEDLIILQDVDTIDEGYDFVTEDGETYYAVTEEGHGDRMIAAMIAYYCIYQNRQFKPKSAERLDYLERKYDPSRQFANTDFSPLHDAQQREGLDRDFMCL